MLLCTRIRWLSLSVYLFFLERLDGGIVEHGATTYRLIPYTHVQYEDRKRAYSPALVIFLQRDPNQTAMALLQTTAMHGRGFGALAIAFSMEDLYGDGANLYEYLGSNPWNKRDPLGLAAWDPFDMVDDYMAESAGSRAAFLSQIGMEAKALAIITATIASYLPFAGPAGDLALFALGVEGGAATAGAMALGIIPGGKLLGGLGRFLGKIGSSAWSAAKRYASNFGSAVMNAGRWVTGGIMRGGIGLARRALEFVGRRKAKGRCGCFIGSTLVLTAAGAVPIDEIEEGTAVFAAQDSGLVTEVTENEVGKKIIIGTASLLHLTLRHADGEIETIHTTDEHPFHNAITGQWTRADVLRHGDRVSTIAGDAVVISIAFGSERVPVYNLSIPGSPTYYVGDRGVWVHNCGFDQLFKVKYEHFMHRKGWDVLTGKANPTRADVAEILEAVTSRRAGELNIDTGVVTIIDTWNGHEIFVQVSGRRADGLFEITSAGLNP